MVQGSVKIESKDLSIEDLFKDFYVVPDFQREYVWEHPQVEKLLQDITDEFYDENNNNIKGTEYFLGSVVSCRNEEGTYSLIDGQQRMTTIYLVLCAIRDLLNELNADKHPPLMNQIASYSTDAQGKPVSRQRIELQYADSQGILAAIVNDVSSLSSISEKTASVRRIRDAYLNIIEYLRVNWGSSGEKDILLFYATFTQRVKLIRIITPSLANALKVFETINDRGVGLNAMDLLKNLLFMKTPQDKYPQLKRLWEELIKVLDQCGEKPLRFLRYFIMSQYDMGARQPLREDDIYNWFTTNTEKTELDRKPLDFLAKLIESAKAWAYFLDAKDVSGKENPYLNNLRVLSGAARQHFILLLAGKHLDAESFSYLCKAIENLFFCYIITREPTKVFERNFALWASDLRKVKDNNQLDKFIANKFTSDLINRKDNFVFAFQQLTQSRIQQYRMRYILAKLTQHIEQAAWSNPAHSSLDQFIAPTVEVEHILPQSPSSSALSDFDKPDEYPKYVERLGNLTLLEKTINSSISNDCYNKKIQGYKQSSFLLTCSLVEKPNVGVKTKLNKAVSSLIEFKHWDSNAIETRQQMLSDLATLVWDMPSFES